MPLKPKKPCSYPGCSKLVQSGYCDRHKPKRVPVKRTKQEKQPYHELYDYKWSKASKTHLNQYPLCIECSLDDKLTPATLVDHITPHAGNKQLFWDRDNWQGLCAPCHGRKSYKESIVGYKTQVTFITGPPSSGKTTWVKSQMRRGDLIIDLDDIFMALSCLDRYDKPDRLWTFVNVAKEAILERLIKPSRVPRAWIISTAPDMATRQQMRIKYAARVVVMETPAEVCVKRMLEDESRPAEYSERMISLVDRWWKKYIPGRMDEIVA